MSRTELVTVDATGPHTSSSMSIRAHSPNPPEPTSSQRRSFDKGDEIELGEINNLKTGSQRSNTPTATPSNKIPRWTAHIQFATMCWTLFLAGWNDGTTGPLLPRIQSNYHVSVQFISGFVVAALANVHLTDRFGFGKVMVLGNYPIFSKQQ
ncbi:hypothetical protein PHLCEN_2v2184 [Hermanssonia centrifuga]|uniref:Uncharacterized protein n=1 Tax=Hermanssonia centrifuga TaxID=98765 RepID=A0A2R6RPW7_9APHY|nr:hypothetical protein PHLCEN_2v2184 [Hermanssonia centrifuga]